MTELELYIQLMTVYLYDNFLFLRQILTLMCQITSEGYFSGNFRSPGEGPASCGLHTPVGVVPRLVLQTLKVHRHPKLSVALLMLRHAHLVVGGGHGRELVEL